MAAGNQWKHLEFNSAIKINPFALLSYQMFSLTLFTIPQQFRLLKITEWVIFFKHTWHILWAILISCGVKTPNFKMPYYKSEGYYRTENLQKEIYLACLMTKESLKLRGSVILHFRILMTSRENQEFFSFLNVERVNTCCQDVATTSAFPRLPSVTELNHAWWGVQLSTNLGWLTFDFAAIYRGLSLCLHD